MSGEDELMWSPRDIRDRLHDAAAAAFAHDAVGLDRARTWLVRASSRDLVRVDGVARQFRYDRPLGGSEQWTGTVLHGSPTAAALASMHPDGHLRERAVRRLALSGEPLSDLAIALRTGDHVEAVRELSTTMLMERTDLDQAARTIPILLRSICALGERDSVRPTSGAWSTSTASTGSGRHCVARPTGTYADSPTAAAPNPP